MTPKRNQKSDLCSCKTFKTFRGRELLVKKKILYIFCSSEIKRKGAHKFLPRDNKCAKISRWFTLRRGHKRCKIVLKLRLLKLSSFNVFRQLYFLQHESKRREVLRFLDGTGFLRLLIFFQQQTEVIITWKKKKSMCITG